MLAAAVARIRADAAERGISRTVVAAHAFVTGALPCDSERDIRVGGGGHRDPWATFVIGDQGFIGDEAFVNVGRPVLIGFSRKRSLGRVAGDPEATTGSVAASVAAAVACYERGASILRVHDVREHVEALAVARAVLVP